MKIEGREVRFPENQYDPVTYIPNHANGNAGHPDCEQGVLIRASSKHLMVLYCKSRTIQTTAPESLVWG